MQKVASRIHLRSLFTYRPVHRMSKGQPNLRILPPSVVLSFFMTVLFDLLIRLNTNHTSSITRLGGSDHVEHTQS